MKSGFIKITFLLFVSFLVYIVISGTTNSVSKKELKSVVLAHCDANVKGTYSAGSVYAVCLSDTALVYYKAPGIESQWNELSMLKGDSVELKGSFSSPTEVKVQNIEKGQSGKTCGGKGPIDSDIRVYFPSGVTSTSVSKTPTGDVCTVCSAYFKPQKEYW